MVPGRVIQITALVTWSTSSLARPICGTPERLTHVTAETPLAHTPPPDGHLVDRDPFSVDANRMSSAHFALKWGSTHPLSTSDADMILSQLEASHDAQVSGWNLPDPTGIGGTLFNVYVGDTGSEVPSVGGSAGYFTLDSEGYPYVVLSSGALGEWDYLESIIDHEFFHAVQWATGAFSLTSSQLWYWEATATWAEGRLQPDHDYFLYWLPWYALRPTTEIGHHSVDDYGHEPPDLHQYGAFILPWYISETFSEEVVLASWRDGYIGEDPIHALDTALGDTEIADVIADQAAANFSWEYAHGERFSSQMLAFSDTFAHRDTRRTGSIALEDNWWTHEQTAPDSYGYHYVALPSSALTQARETQSLALAIGVHSTEDSDLSYRARLIEGEGGVYTSHIVDSHARQTWIEISPGVDELWLAVTTTTDPEDIPGDAAYQYRWMPLEELEDTGAPDTAEDEPVEDTAETSRPVFHDEPTRAPKTEGCSCSTGSPASMLWLAPLLLLRRKGDISAA
jgi:hypothetical protein